MNTLSIFCIWLLMWADQDMWNVLEKVPFSSKYVESENASFYFPEFTDELLALEGKKVKITGYYLPIDLTADAIVLSRYPMATCFFCGEAGPESVMMVYPNKKVGALQMDQKVTFEGLLQLNNSDVYQLSFILKDATRL